MKKLKINYFLLSGIFTLTCCLFSCENETVEPDAGGLVQETSSTVSTSSTLYSNQVLWSFNDQMVDNREYLTGDFNGDGKEDILKIRFETANDAFVFLSTGSTFQIQSEWTTNDQLVANRTYLVGDVNGDGKDDIVKIRTETENDAFVFISTGSSFLPQVQWSFSNQMVDNREYFLGDVNGDGRADLVKIMHEWNNDAFVFLSTGSGFNPQVQWTNSDQLVADREYFVEDVNGDGKADIVKIRHETENDSFVFISTGTSFNMQVQWSFNNQMVADRLYFMGDQNGDGKADIIKVMGEPNNAPFVFLSGGGSFASQIKGNESGTMLINRRYLCADVNGDNKDDIIKVMHGAENDALVYLAN